jgi:hypothetical protein
MNVDTISLLMACFRTARQCWVNVRKIQLAPGDTVTISVKFSAIGPALPDSALAPRRVELKFAG